MEISTKGGWMGLAPRPPALEAAHGWALLPLALFAWLASLADRVATGEAIRWSVAWVPSLAIEGALRLDGLALLFALLISGIGALVLLYSVSYLAGHPQRGRFLFFLLLFMGAMLGLVLADNLLMLFIFWEATSITSFLLVGFKHESEKARKAALQALLVTGGGGLALLAGLLMLGSIGGTVSISALVAGGSLAAHPLYPPMLLLILLGAFTKSAQFPFHFWLPGAMAAPTPASAYLHSATMVKAGIYLLARLLPVLGGTLLWQGLVTGVGATTMLVGAWLAWRQSDLKRILAYSTVSALGSLTMLLGVGSTVALKGALLLLLAHALYKAALFLVVGAIDHETGTREIGQLRGLRHAMPLTAAAAGLAALSLAGLPPLIGFLSKEILYEATLAAPAAAWLTGAAVAANALGMMVAGMVALRPFWGELAIPRPAREAPAPMWVGPLLLAILGLGAGLLPGWVGRILIAPAVSASAGEAVAVKLSLWHGFNPMLALSALTVALGLAAYAGRARLLHWTAALDGGRVGPARGYEAGWAALLALAEGLTRRLQSGYLRRYLLIIVGMVLLLAGGALLGRVGVALPHDATGIRPHEGALALLILAATGVAVRATSRLTAVVAVGVVGYGIALLFTFFGAPDLAMTQFAIETLTVILLVLVLYRLPRFAARTTPATRARDGAVALLAGGLMSAFVLAVLALPHPQRLTPFFAESSVPLAQGRNVVNVILVDFRALDTLGEIVVLAVAALGVVALLRLRLDERGEEESR